jgi:SNF2 family DNA or RNA helicase
MSLTLKTELKDFQVKTVKWMAAHEYNNDGGLLMNSAGLGKSMPMSITMMVVY